MVVAVGEQFPLRMERVTGLLEKMKLLASEKKGIPKGDLQKASENAHTISESGTSGPVLRVPMKFMAWNYQGLGNALTMRGLLQIDIFWKQGAHVNWLMKGHGNTAFFQPLWESGDLPSVPGTRQSLKNTRQRVCRV